MARVLSLALAASLVALSNGQITQFFPRADTDPTDIRICRAPGWQNDLVARFTGIFFGDFYTGGGQDIYGSLAVKGNFHAPNYVVNLKHGAICEEVNSFNSYGLVVGGITDTFNTHVHGSAYLKQGGTVEEVLELDSGCLVTQDYETGIFNFDEVENLLLTTSSQLAALTPTAILEDDSTLTLLRNTHPDYEVLTFHSCAQGVCSADSDTESSTAHLTGVTGFWNGVQGENQPDYDKTYVFNIPVTNGGTIKFTVNNPSNSFNACKLVYNFYPVDASGKYVENGDFTLIRQTAADMAGFVLAPRGHIVDGTEGNFAGNVVGLDYTWLDLNNGVEIKDYEDNGDCDQYIGCLPLHQHTDHTTVILTLPPMTTASRTKTWSTTQNTLSDMMNTEDPVTYSEDTEEDVSTITLTDCPYDDTIVVTSTTTVEDTDYVVTTKQVTRSSFTTETTTIDGPTVIETDGDVTITELTTTTEFETEYVEVVETYTDYEIIDGTTHLIEATTTTTVILLEPVTKSECDMRTRTYYTGCETVNTCSGTECVDSSTEIETSSTIVTSDDESSIVTSDETSEEEGHHTWDHSHKHKHKHKYNKHKGHHHGKDEECNEGGDDDDEDDDDDEEEDWDKDDEDDKDWEGKDDDEDDEDDDKEWEGKDDDWEDKHKDHHHGKDEECNEE